MEENIALEIKDLRKEFKKKLVLDKINLIIKKGEIFGIIGLCGSGKTTLFNTIVGLIEPEEGEIIYYNEGKQIKLGQNNEIVKKQFGFATQEPSFYPKLTTEENLDYFGALYQINNKIRKEYIKYLLNLVHLIEVRNTISSSLSGGMQKRLTIACALIHNPKLLILDEPTADLDPYLRTKTWDIIRNIRKQGTTVVLSSHFLDEVDILCDRIAILHNGVILEAGTPDELKEKYSKNEEIEIQTTPGNYDKIYQKIQTHSLPITKAIKKEKKLVLYTQKPEQTLHKLLHLIEDMDEELIDLKLNKPTLAEVFESLTYKNVKID